LSFCDSIGSAIDATKNQIRPLSDLTFLAACDSPSSGRVVPSKRLLQSFSIFALPDPAAKQLFHIYSVRLGRFFNSLDFTVDIRSSLYPLISACLVMYYRVSINILPTPSKVHYIFNLRDLGKLAQGLMQASPLNITNQERVRNRLILLEEKKYGNNLDCCFVHLFSWQFCLHTNVYACLPIDLLQKRISIVSISI
jgi:hypothetical protein